MREPGVYHWCYLLAVSTKEMVARQHRFVGRCYEEHNARPCRSVHRVHNGVVELPSTCLVMEATNTENQGRIFAGRAAGLESSKEL